MVAIESLGDEQASVTEANPSETVQVSGGAPPEQIPGAEVSQPVEPGSETFGPLHELGIEITSLRRLDDDEKKQVQTFLEAPKEQTTPEAYNKQITILSELKDSLLALEEYELTGRLEKTIKDANSEVRRDNLEQTRSGGRLTEQVAYAAAEKALPLLDPMLDDQAEAAAKQQKISEARSKLGRVIAGLGSDTVQARADTATDQFDNAVKGVVIESDRRG